MVGLGLADRRFGPYLRTLKSIAQRWLKFALVTTLGTISRFRMRISDAVAVNVLLRPAHFFSTDLIVRRRVRAGISAILL
jgi:hypothetical protein